MGGSKEVNQFLSLELYSHKVSFSFPSSVLFTHSVSLLCSYAFPSSTPSSALFVFFLISKIPVQFFCFRESVPLVFSFLIFFPPLNLFVPTFSISIPTYVFPLCYFLSLSLCLSVFLDLQSCANKNSFSPSHSISLLAICIAIVTVRLNDISHSHRGNEKRIRNRYSSFTFETSTPAI